MKKIFGIIAIAAIAAVGWNYSQSQNKVELSDLALANVEALAWEENNNGKGLPTSKEITKYFYDDQGRVSRTEKYTASCCAAGSLDCSNPPCSDPSL